MPPAGGLIGVRAGCGANEENSHQFPHRPRLIRAGLFVLRKTQLNKTSFG
jgi:hypothetical protein